MIILVGKYLIQQKLYHPRQNIRLVNFFSCSIFYTTYIQNIQQAGMGIMMQINNEIKSVNHELSHFDFVTNLLK